MEEIIHPKGKIFYSMGEVCEIFDVNASLLRFWEEQFAALKPKKNGRGHRIYTPEDVDTIRQIYHLVKEQGMTLEGADKRMRQNRDGLRRDAEIVEHLRSIRNLLTELKAELGDDTEVIYESDERAEPMPAFEPMPVADPDEEPEADSEPFTPTPVEDEEDAPADEPQTVAADEQPKPRIIEQTLF